MTSSDDFNLTTREAEKCSAVPRKKEKEMGFNEYLALPPPPIIKQQQQQTKKLYHILTCHSALSLKF